VAIALVFLLPAIALVLYQDVGNPRAMGMAKTAANTAGKHETGDTGDIDALVNNLRSRLTEDRESLDGWVLLARTLKSMQRYPEALEALETAKRIAPEDPYVAVELVETRIFLSPQGRMNDEMVAMLQTALTADPNQQKALWLLGIAATQAGEDEAAISYWETLLQQLDPATTIAGSVNKQIAAAQNRLGIESTVSTGVSTSQPETGAGVETVARAATQQQPKPQTQAEPTVPPEQSEGTWAGMSVRVSAAGEIQSKIPPDAVLWVMIRSAGPAVGPPLGVRRLSSSSIPLEITISDQDSMMKERLISSQSEVQLQARISLSGTPQARSGDWQSAPVTVPLSSTETLELTIDQQVE